MISRDKPLPPWSRLALWLAWIAIAAVGAVGLADKRGVVVGVVAAIVYGPLSPALVLAWGRTTALSKRLQTLYVWMLYPLWLPAALFVWIAYQTRLPAAICLLIALLAGLLAGLLVELGLRRRRARQQNSL